MPRTRAAHRSQASPEDTQIAANTPLPATPPVTRRKPLREISGNQEEVPGAVDNPEEILKGPGKGKKGKNIKKSKKDAQTAKNHGPENVLPDKNESETSSAVEDACQDLLKEQPQGVSQVIMDDEISRSPPSPAVTAVTKQLSSSSTPGDMKVTAETRVDLNVYAPQAEDIPIEQGVDSVEDNEQMLNETYMEAGKADDEESPAALHEEERSPTKAPMRPEDSIEAIDKFEDEMEKVGNLIPAIKGSGPVSTEPKKGDRKAATKKANTEQKHSNTPGPSKAPAARPLNAKSSAEAAVLMKRELNVHHPSLSRLETPTVGLKDRQVPSSSSGSEKGISTATKKRVSFVHKAPFVPAKSTKPLTRPSFELPGEVVARKLKEAKEERIKREEEEKEKPIKTTFKARPIRLSQAPAVKPTATSRARISMAKGETPAVAATKEATSKAKSAFRPSTISTASAGKRFSTLSVDKRPDPAPANASRRVSRGPSSTGTVSTVNRNKARPSQQASVRQSVNPADTKQLKAKGKEVFNRGKVEQEERDKMRKEKEEAAKKARAEAAERGRIASREWAEKQKAKKMMGAKMADKKAEREVAASAEASVSA
ncbi:MAG: hypothetical protein Q9201_004548 [Fulgogasparrea decipioides]